MRTAAPAGDHGPGGAPLLAAKLSVPRIHLPLVYRPRLADLVSAGVEGPLTVVSGPAGSGKTLLVASWCTAATPPGPVAWLTLERDDDESGAFWAYVLAALRRVGVPFPDDVGAPFTGRGVARSLLARIADTLASRTVPVVLVLDQFDAVAGGEVRTDIEFLLRNAAPMLRLVVLARDETALPVHRYELRGEVTRIRGQDLAFTSDEAADLLRQHDLRLSAAGLAVLTGHTHGWAAALRLSAVAMQRRRDPEAFVRSLPGADATLTAYLVDEVLEAQPPGVRDFLLHTCVVDRLCAALADSLTGRVDGTAVLAGLHAGNVLTTTVEEAPGWYRYHPLLVHVLREELRRTDRDLVDELHRRAAVWSDAAGLVLDAVRHAAAASDWQLATGTVVRRLAVGTLLAGRDSAHLDNALAALPAGAAGSMPAVVRAARALTRFDLDACRREVAAAEEHAAAEPDDARPALLASTAVIRAILARVAGDLPAAEAALASGEAQLAAVPAAAEHPELRALLLSNVGTVELWTGEWDDAERTLRRGLVVAAGAGCEYPRLNILGRLALLEFLRGRSGQAEELGRQELALAEDSGLPVDHRTGAGHLVLAMVAVERADPAAARSHLDRAERSVGARHDPFVSTFVPLVRAVERADRRDPRRASAALSRVPLVVGGRPLPAWLADRVALTAAEVHLECGNAEAVAAALDDVGRRSAEWAVLRSHLLLERGDRPEAARLLSAVLGAEGTVGSATVEAWLLTARVHHAEGRLPAVREALGRALAAARPERRRRLLLRPGPTEHLLRAFPGLLAAHPWLIATSPGATREGGQARQSPAHPPEPLTARESTVLARMAQAMSVDDIAQDLFVSVNTVKTHQRSIYRKLGVTRRNEAVRRARQLGLV